MKLETDVDGLTHTKQLCIVYIRNTSGLIKVKKSGYSLGPSTGSECTGSESLLIIASLYRFVQYMIRLRVVRVFSDVLVAFLYFDICHYRQSNLSIENPEFSQPVVAGHFQ